MSGPDTSQTVVYADLAGRRRRFCLRLGEIEELERICSAGIGAIMLRLATHNFYARDIFDTVRLGLEGGGATEAEATAIARRCAERPVAENSELASMILNAALSGVPAEEGNGAAETTDDPATSPPSSEPGLPSGSDQETSDA